MIEFEGKIKMIAVPVLGNEYAFSLIKLYNVTVLAYKYKTIHEGGDSSAIIVLPKGNDYAIIGLSSEILKSEELAERYVDASTWHFPEEHNVFMNYTEPLKEPNKASGQWRQEWNVSFAYATDSFQSLLDRYNIKGENLILEVK